MQETNIENKQAEVKIDRDAYNKKSFYKQKCINP